MAIYSGFTHEKWGFSIVMLVYQRVTLTNWCRISLAHPQYVLHKLVPVIPSGDQTWLAAKSLIIHGGF